jgi:hypothetical protein
MAPSFSSSFSTMHSCDGVDDSVSWLLISTYGNVEHHKHNTSWHTAEEERHYFMHCWPFTAQFFEHSNQLSGPHTSGPTVDNLRREGQLTPHQAEISVDRLYAQVDKKRKKNGGINTSEVETCGPW